MDDLYINQYMDYFECYICFSVNDYDTSLKKIGVSKYIPTKDRKAGNLWISEVWNKALITLKEHYYVFAV